MKEKCDFRSKIKKRNLRSALCELLYEKPINKITIRELAEKAGISRCTFYLYYDSIYDMVKSIEDDMLSEYREGLRSILSENEDALISRLITFTLWHKYENLPYSKLLYTNSDNQEISRQYSNIIIEEFGEVFPEMLQGEMIMLFQFYISGITTLIQEWLLNNIEGTPEEMSEHILNVLTNGGIFLEMFNKVS